MIDFQINELLHPRILKSCEKLFNDGHYDSAVLKAMTQVELALKEKSGERKKFGVNLISHLFGEGKSIKLRMPFGEEMQKETESYFKSAFSFYRNYAAHDGSKIDRTWSFRSLLVASELLNLIGASIISFSDIGGIPGLVKTGIFRDEDSVLTLLRFLDGYTFPIEGSDGYFEDLSKSGYDDSHVQAVADTGLVEFGESECFIPEEFQHVIGAAFETLGSFTLTPLGEEVVNDANANSVLE